MTSNARAFTQKLSKHHAADVRRNVACHKGGVVSPSSSSSWSNDVVDPIDFEEFLSQYQNLIDRDPLRLILDVPQGDVEVEVIERPIRTLHPILPEEKLETLPPHVQACVECYTSNWKVVRCNHRNLSSSVSSRPNLSKSLQPSPKQEFEIDFQHNTFETTSESDLTSISSSSRQSIASLVSVSSCGDTLTPRNSWASLDLRHSAGDPLIAEILEQNAPETLDQLNESRRQTERQDAVFALCSGPEKDSGEPIERRMPAAPPSEPQGHRVLVKCHQLTLDLEVEPLFASMALYDSKERKKLSETFYFDLNPEGLKRMLGGHVPYSDTSTLARGCIFNISNPSPDLFLVVRLEKVLQGDLSECVEPYMKEERNRDKLKANAVAVCERLGKYRQAFAWTGIYLMNVINGGNSMERDSSDRDSFSSTSTTNSLDRKLGSSSLEQLRRRATDMGSLTRRGSLERRTDKRRSWSPDHLASTLESFRPITLTVSSFFKQEGEKLRDEDLYKCLHELKKPTTILKKLKCIPATLKLEIAPCAGDYKNCLTTELMKLKPYPDDKGRPVKELLEFPLKELLVPHYTYRNLLFVSPKELNFSNRAGSARNLTVKVQLMAGEMENQALCNIYGKSSCPEMTNEAYTVVTYHSKNPFFYDEIKMKLPAALSDNHHLLFTFYHISCQKKVEQYSVDTPVGYTWLPLIRDGRLISGEFCLPVMLETPPKNYSYIPPDVYLPGTKWLDNHKGLFTVHLDSVSSVHTHDPAVERFLSAYDYVQTGVIPPRLGEAGLENELRAALLSLAGAKPETILKNLPLIFDSLLELLVQPPRISGHTLNIGQTTFEALCLLLENVSKLDLPMDQHSRNALLATYIHYQCNLPHPLSTSTHSSPEWEEGAPLTRSNSNPDIEVAHLQQSRGLDRAASMRVPNNDQISSNINTCHRIVHHELALQWVVSSGRIKDLAMQNAWFLFELITKSMVEHLAHTRSLESPRKMRFSEQFLDDIFSLVHTITAEIISHSTSDIRRAHILNAALAFFFFDLLSICDRGAVFNAVRYYNKQLQAKIMSMQDAAVLVELKLECARIICSHEHYVALNLPFATPFMVTGPSVSPSPSVTSSTSQNSFLSGPAASQERVSTFAELSPEYRQHHYLTGIVLTDVTSILLDMNKPNLHVKAVDTIKSLLSWHDSDPRYSTSEARRRVAALYLPLLSIAMDVLPLLHRWSSDKTDRYPTEEEPNINQTVALAIAGKVSPVTCDNLQSNRKSGISAEVTRNLLTCVLWVLKNIERESLSQWLGELTSSRLATLLHLLDACTSCFEYRPRRRAPPPSGYAHAQVSQDGLSLLEDVILGQGSAREMMQRRKGGIQTPGSSETKLRWRKEQMAAYRPIADVVDRPKEDLFNDVHLEGHFATEASFIILDTLERCVATVAQWDSQQYLVGLALTVLLHALSKNQSTTILPHLFASQRNLVFKFHSALFDEESTHCADLCLLLLKHCGSQIASVRSQAAASLYLLMRQTFQIGNNFARVKMQVTMSLSSLVGTSASFSDESLRRSLKTILEYGERDTELQETTFPEQVRDLVFNLHMILSDTVKMKEFQEDPEMLLDLMYRIAKGYQNSPDLRLTWLENMAQKHMERSNHCEAGMCLVHSAALVAEYLVMSESSPHLPAGAAALERVSPNVLEESAVSDDVLSPEKEGGCLGSHFTEAGLVGLLEQAASSFHVAAMYEPMNDIYRVLIPIAENNRDFKKLANIHGKLHDAYTRIDQLQGKRMFGTYFRVGFYGSKFGDLDREEFIYKEPTLTKLPEIFSRLENFYAERFGPENVIIIKDSNIVDISALDPEKAYIQITYVEPYFEQYELRYRQTHFDRNFNIKRFVYATPFTMTGKAHGELREQYKRKTILTTAVHFPYVKTRIQVVNRVQITLTPIEVAIEDIQKKTNELAAATQQEPPDPKILQMVLQGCIGTTVNQGPLEMALTFLPSDGKALTKHQNKLRLCFKDFCKKCFDALKKNRNLIGPDQRDYQRELDRNYKRFTEKLQPLVNPQNITIVNASPHKYSNESTYLRW